MTEQIRGAIGDLSITVMHLMISKAAMDASVPDSDDLRVNLYKLTVVSALYKDIIVSLCTLIDDTKGTNGGPQVIRWIKGDKRIPESQITVAEAALERLRESIGVLETHRHERIAHLASVRTHYGPHPSVLPAIAAAVNFVDVLREERTAYFDAAGIDLRATVLREPTG